MKILVLPCDAYVHDDHIVAIQDRMLTALIHAHMTVLYRNFDAVTRQHVQKKVSLSGLIISHKILLFGAISFHTRRTRRRLRAACDAQLAGIEAPRVLQLLVPLFWQHGRMSHWAVPI